MLSGCSCQSWQGLDCCTHPCPQLRIRSTSTSCPPQMACSQLNVVHVWSAEILSHMTNMQKPRGHPWLLPLSHLHMQSTQNSSLIHHQNSPESTMSLYLLVQGSIISSWPNEKDIPMQWQPLGLHSGHSPAAARVTEPDLMALLLLATPPCSTLFNSSLFFIGQRQHFSFLIYREVAKLMQVFPVYPSPSFTWCQHLPLLWCFCQN